MKKIFGLLVLVSTMCVGTAFATPTNVELTLKYSGSTGNLSPTVKLTGTCSKACKLQMRGYVHYEGLGKTGAVLGNVKSIQFRGSQRTFKFKAVGLPKLLSYKGQDGKVTIQARVFDTATNEYVYSTAVARFVKCGTGRNAVSRQVWLKTLENRIR